MEKSIASRQLIRNCFLAILFLFFTLLVFIILFNVNAKAEVPITGGLPCGAICHSIPGNYEDFHDTKYDSLKWPNLDPDCKQCHVATSTKTLNPNIAQFHVFKKTTTYSEPSYPNGMGCDSCHHNYLGSKLDKTVIAAAINTGNTDCSSCHGDAVGKGHEAFHDTTYVDNPAVDCSSCHEMTSNTTGKPNLWKWHLNRPTTSYPGGMDCQSCHNYTGSKLNKTNIESAIASSNTKCDACHTIHDIDPNIKHRTSFLGNSGDCNTCHEPSRVPKDTTDNLQDLHVNKQTTTYPLGMTCDSCHKYSGTKLSKADIDKAVSDGNTACNACHKSIGPGGHEAQHQTPFDSSISYGESLCSKCHITDESKTAPYTLWDVHLNKKSSNYTEMNCTTCHNYTGSKLSKPDIDNAIATGNKNCAACHTTIGQHAKDKYNSISSSVHTGKDCLQCHQRATDTIAKPAVPDSTLLTIPGSNICFSCHSSTGAAPNVLASFMKPSRHKTPECGQCHDPHIADKTSAQAPAADGALKGSKGVAVNNGAAGTSPSFTLLSSVSNQYELCFLCHSNNNYNIYGSIPAGTKDKAVEFNTNNLSFHPVEGTGKNLGIKEIAFVQGSPWNPTSAVEGDYSTASPKIYCTDCHGSDNSSEPKGPHGSNIARILKKPVTPGLPLKTTSGKSVVGPTELCFSCHAYDVYVNGQPGSRFPRHQYHVQNQRLSCGTCHDAHGTSNKEHLMGGTEVVSGFSHIGGEGGFTHTSSGGFCDIICHSEKSYIHNYPHVDDTTGTTVNVDQALKIEKLKEYIYSDSSGSKSDITAKMSDGSFKDAYKVEYNSGSHKVIAIKTNKDANGYSKVVLRFYVKNIDGSPSGRIYAYQSDGNSLNTSGYTSYTVSSNGWNEVDVTTTASMMNGYGWMKFRLVSTSRKYEVAETEFRPTPK